jgi:hypothetical protein
MNKKFVRIWFAGSALLFLIALILPWVDATIYDPAYYRGYELLLRPINAVLIHGLEVLRYLLDVIIILVMAPLMCAWFCVRNLRSSIRIQCTFDKKRIHWLTFVIRMVLAIASMGILYLQAKLMVGYYFAIMGFISTAIVELWLKLARPAFISNEAPRSVL